MSSSNPKMPCAVPADRAQLVPRCAHATLPAQAMVSPPKLNPISGEMKPSAKAGDELTSTRGTTLAKTRATSRDKFCLIADAARPVSNPRSLLSSSHDSTPRHERLAQNCHSSSIDESEHPRNPHKVGPDERATDFQFLTR